MTPDPDPNVIEPLADKSETPLMAFTRDLLLRSSQSEGCDREFPPPCELPPLAFNSSDSSEVILQIYSRCQQSPIGKKLPTALYVHISALKALDPLLQLYESHASRHLNSLVQTNLIKFHSNQPKISYLFYPDFDNDSHPVLQASTQINLESGKVKYQDYSNSENPPILHRKETFVTPDYPKYEKFAQLTRYEEELGLLDYTCTIGTRQGWLEILENYGVEIHEHSVVKHNELPEKTPPEFNPKYRNDTGQLPEQEPLEDVNSENPCTAFSPCHPEPENDRPLPHILLPNLKIERHKAAMFRKELSKPVRIALEANFLTEGTTFFDYGCGYGGDLQRIAEKGCVVAGWDPYYQPDVPLNPADIVNLGYVINVIESQAERREALIKAWDLTKKVLIVAAQVLIGDRNKGQIAYEDGIITCRNTFQKYYEQEELKSYIDQVLNVDSVPVALGIYFVFRDEAEAQIFRASRFHRRLSTPRVSVPSKRFEDYQELLAPLMAFVSDRGRLPVAKELPEESIIKAEFISFKRAFRVILQATDPQEWEAISNKRRQDLLVYIALNNLAKILPLQKLPLQIKDDIKGLFVSYKKLCILADLMLFSLGNPDVIADCCKSSPIGRKIATSLWVHVSALEELDPLLRLYEGCANRTIGRLEGATIIKLNAKKPLISYFFYPDFETDAHPALHTVMHINLRDFSVGYEDYSTSLNPPILHRKETYVTPNYPLYQKFIKLSFQEEVLGLFDERGVIKTRNEWLNCLKEHCVKIKNHRLVWRSDADPEEVKRLKAAMGERLKKKREEEEKPPKEMAEISSELTQNFVDKNESVSLKEITDSSPASSCSESSELLNSCNS